MKGGGREISGGKMSCCPSPFELIWPIRRFIFVVSDFTLEEEYRVHEVIVTKESHIATDTLLR